MDEHDDEGYAGAATLVLDGEQIAVEVLLRSRHEPFDGRLHWSGRVREHPRLTEMIGNGSAEVEVRIERSAGGASIGTDDHAAPARLTEPDVWARYRITGTGLPPFALDAPPSPEED